MELHDTPKVLFFFVEHGSSRVMSQDIGNYRLIRLLGRGASGEVHLGEHIHLQTFAAIKLLHDKGNLSTTDKEEFIKEAQIIAKLHHQHIVRVLDFAFTAQGIPFLVMEYAAQGSLRQRHPPGTQPPLLAIVAYLKHISAALTYVHQAGVTHADIKPENMLLGDANQLLLGDFGIATLSRSTTQLICGTPAYMAPEQIQLHPCAASDQYALAIVAYEWLCGRVPFQGQTTSEIIAQQIQATPQPLRQFVPGLAVEIEQVVLRALSKDPAARFPDVAAFVSAFEQAAFMPTSIPALPPIPPTQPAARATPIPPTQPMQVVQPVIGNATTILRINTQLVAPKPIKPITRKQGETLYALNLEAGAVRALAWSPDGNTLAAGSDYQEVFLWEALTGTGKHAYHLHEHQIRGLAWSPKRRVLASVCAEQLIHVWEPDKTDPQPLLTYRGHVGNFTLGLACVVAWSPSGLLLASAGTDQTAQVWRVSDGTLLCTCRGHSNDINALVWSPNGTQLATGSDDSSVRVWNAHSGQEIAVFQHHRRKVYSLAWSPDGTRLTSAGEGSHVYTWQVSETTQPRYTMYQGHARSVYVLAWSPDGTQLASASRDTTAQIWRADDGAQQYMYTGHTSSVLSLAWSPDGAQLATADEDGQVRVWQARS